MRLYSCILFFLFDTLFASNDSIVVFNPSTFYDCNAVALQYNEYAKNNRFKVKYTFEKIGEKFLVYKDSVEYGSLNRDAKTFINEFGDVELLDSIIRSLNNLKSREYRYKESECDSNAGVRMIFWNVPHCKMLSTIRCVDKEEDVWFVENRIRKLIGLK